MCRVAIVWSFFVLFFGCFLSFLLLRPWVSIYYRIARHWILVEISGEGNNKNTKRHSPPTDWLTDWLHRKKKCLYRWIVTILVCRRNKQLDLIKPGGISGRVASIWVFCGLHGMKLSFSFFGLLSICGFFATYCSSHNNWILLLWRGRKWQNWFV